MKEPRTNGAVKWICLSAFLFLQLFRAGANVTVNIQPGNQTVPVNEQAIFGAVVVTSGGETVTGYQWFTSTNTTGPFASAGTAAALVFNNVQLTNAGYYYVTVTYQSHGGTFTLSSTQVNLTVDPKPRVDAQPVDLTSPPGSSATFSVTPGGQAPLALQWRHNGGPLSDDTRISGSESATLQIQNLVPADGGNYDIVVANSYGSITSQVAVLTVGWIPPVITSATNLTGKQGYTFQYPIAVTGTPPITFGADGLPDGLSVNPTNASISGVPQVYGVFNATLYATNGGSVTSTNLTFTLADDIPVITSGTNASGKQGYFVSYTITATNDPAWFGATPLPLGMNVDSTNGTISGIPLVSGVFPLTIQATNAYGVATQTLTLDLASGAPLITSSLTKNGKQGVALSYTIRATNNPATYTASPLPAGLNINPTNGVISGVPLVNGSFAVTIGSQNVFGADSQTLALNLSSSVPAITSFLSDSGQEETPYGYNIQANNSPTSFWATGLPFGLSVDTNSGAITGTPLYAGNYSVPLYAANAWGVGTATLQLSITNLVVTNLMITNVVANYFKPYMVEFSFSLRDDTNYLTSHAVVASPTLMSVAAFEAYQNATNQVSPSEAGLTLQPPSSKVLKGYLVLDFTESVASMVNGDANGNGISDAVDAEVAGAIDFVNQQPPGSQIGVYEFHRDDVAPQQVLPLTSDKTLLTHAIAGIWTNYVQNFPAGSRTWDAMGAAIGALGTTNSDESHYIVLMSDGQDDASTFTFNGVTNAATTNNVQVFCVGFGDELDSNTLQNLSDSTLGSFYNAGTDVSALQLSFAKIGKDLRSRYVIRWATLNRTPNSFIPSFQISYQGITALSPTNFPFINGTNTTIDTNNGVVTTNSVPTYGTNYFFPPYSQQTYSNNILAGAVRLVSDADVNPASITLRASYVPRYIRQMRVHYRPNWPVSLKLDTTNSGAGVLDGWTLTQTNDGAGGQWATLSSTNPAILATSIPFATLGNLLTFTFNDPINSSNAFSLFALDNTIYTNTANTNFYGFNLTNAASFITVFPPPPPHGTPIPWLQSYGFTGNPTNAELIATNGNGFAVWQDYLAGLNPLDSNSTFQVVPTPGQNPPQINFNTVINRTYRIDWSISLNGPWLPLRDGITGTGGVITFTDVRNLSSVGSMFYRVAVEGP